MAQKRDADTNADVRSVPCADGRQAPTVDLEAKTLLPGPDVAGPGTGSSECLVTAEEGRARRFGEYDLLEEVARGGMGVVLRARDRKLNRIVALKMVLSGRFASEHEVRRFHVEAEAAARLDHRGIVPIYEIGECDGQHYFTMKLVPGGSLAGRLGELRRDVRAIVALLAKVASAVSHAHQRGILHRDLKPANILIDDAGEPLVSDLGLAKSVQNDSQLTQSGAIVGTPSYMSPEQAAGTSDVTTAADVYSLGAILYEALTGRPPHQAGTALDTLLKVLHDTPAPPRSLDPAIDRSLELVAMKCLEHSPADRYSSAAAFANDLERWLAGEPLSVRSPSATSAAQLWLRRNMRSAVGAAVVGLLAGIACGAIFWFAAISPRLAPAARVYDAFPSEPRPMGAFGFATPDWVRQGTFLWMISLLMFVGLVNVAVVRPVRRAGWIASGVICGLSVALGSFAVSFGWGPIVMRSVYPSYDDIHLLSRAVFVDSDTDAQRLRRSIVRRHPDLAQIGQKGRAGLLASKIVLDEMSGVPAGLWLGIAFSLVAGMVPAVCGTLLAGSLLERTGKFARVIGPYAEIMGSVTPICVIGVAYGLGEVAGSQAIVGQLAVPPAAIQVPFFVGLALAGFAALRQWTPATRLLASSIWIVALAATVAFFVRVSHTFDAAADLVADGRLEGAAERLEEFIRHQPNDAMARFDAGILRLKLGQFDRYQTHCQEMLDEFRRTHSPADADKTAKLCLLVPGALTDPAPAFELAELAVDEGYQTPYEVWFYLVRGLADYRAGRFDEAQSWLQQCQAVPDTIRGPTARLVESMALARLGRTEEARTALGEATSAFDQYLASGAPDEIAGRWYDRMIF
ncbi:MAG TPA: serine/threonine-protein kinase, partial [Pirellulales bacterium]|nr:serine/threonine-protein kinase [Pirellulales bacterium]